MKWYELFKENTPKKRWSVTFVPATDITTYELAICLKWYVLVLSCTSLKGAHFKKTFDEEQPETIKRHFKWVETGD